MKMFFSANKRKHTPPNPLSIDLSQIQEKTQPIETQINKQDLFYANTYAFKSGMFNRIQGTSGCSNCGK